MVTNLAEELRKGTTKAHSMAENVSFVKSFLGGVVDKQKYRKLLANLYFIYNELERQIEANIGHSIIQHLYFKELVRKDSLEEDLLYYYGETWSDQISPSKATEVYITRLEQIGDNSPELLIAHAYTRYMGDLSGGQILKKIAQKAMHLSGNQGTSFYEFNTITDEKAFKTQYKEVLNQLPLDKSQMNAIIAEANIAFTLNMKVFQELDSNIIKIMVMLLINTVNSFFTRSSYS